MLRSRLRSVFEIALALVLVLVVAGCQMPASAVASQSVQLVQPAEGAQFNVGETVSVVSSFSDSGGAKGVILEINGVAARDDKFVSPIFQGRMDQPWRPVKSGPAILCVYLSTSDGKVIRSRCVAVTVGPVSGPTSAALLPFTPTTEFTAAPAASATPGAPTVTATQDANCRLGPGAAYEVSAGLVSGQTAPITGRNTDSSWWVIQIPGSGDCWIWEGTVTVAGDTSRVPVKAPPALPTATFTQPAPLSAPSPISPSGAPKCADVTGGVTLSWSAVTHPNGIDHYEWALQGGVNKTGSTGSTSAHVTMINCGASYQWRVRAVDKQGNIGPWSNYVQFKVP